MKGRQIGVGGSAEVFEWPGGRVLKLFRPRYRYAVEMESERARAVHAAGIPAPAVLEVREVDGRLGIVYERVDGPTLLERLSGPAADHVAVGRLLADLHVEMHRHVVAELPPLLDSIARVLSALPEGEREHHQRLADQLPRGTSVYHGDFHPGNIIMGARPIVIDWVNAHSSHPTIDVARSLILMRYQGVREISGAEARSGVEIRARVASAYLDRYTELAELRPDELAACESFQAAALLRAVPLHPLRDELGALASRA